LTHLHEDCEVEILQSLRAIPSSCSQRIAEINRTIWTQLDDNQWLYVAPRPGALTILYSKQEPSDIEFEGTGKLSLHSNCKAYVARVIIQAQTTVSSNNSEKDIIPPLSLDYDCCNFVGGGVKLNDVHLELPMKNVINRLDDLSHKVEEMDRLISEQGWKLKHSTSDFHLSFLSYVGMVTTGIVMILFCYCCCCKCCKRNFPNFFKWWRDTNPCTTIVIKPKIVNSVYSSNESLRTPTARISRVRGPLQDDALEETELVSLRTLVNKWFHPVKDDVI
jgi:hypothetical protein